MNELELAAIAFAAADRDWRTVAMGYASEWERPAPDRGEARRLFELREKLYLRREAAQERLLELGRELLARRAAA